MPIDREMAHVDCQKYVARSVAFRLRHSDLLLFRHLSSSAAELRCGSASLWKQGKPVDLIYFPDGQHILRRPLERMASQQGNVDWFRFWLKVEEDSDPAKAEQYKRWRELRKMQAENEAKAKAAKEKPAPVN
jgi:hypothetical protein